MEFLKAQKKILGRTGLALLALIQIFAPESVCLTDVKADTHLTENTHTINWYIPNKKDLNGIYQDNTKNDPEPFFDGIFYEVPEKFLDSTPTPTQKYLANKDFQERLYNSYTQAYFNPTRNMLKDDVGLDYLASLFDAVIEKEKIHCNDHHVFYHAQQRKFVFYHDLSKALHHVAFHQSLRDFIILRNTHQPFWHKIKAQLNWRFNEIKKRFSFFPTHQSEFESVNDFINFYMQNGLMVDGPFNYGFDHKPEIAKQLLAVNPSLFGNFNNSGECTFDYYLISKSINSPDLLKTIESLFTSFKYKKFYKKYITEIGALLLMLSAVETKGTGNLLQIFVPKELVNKLVYRCKPYGYLTWKDDVPENHPALDDLERHAASTNLGEPENEFINMQLRMLINKTTLDAKSGIKFFRYCKETEVMKEYHKKFNELIENIMIDVENTPAENCWNRCLQRLMQFSSSY